MLWKIYSIAENKSSKTFGYKTPPVPVARAEYSATASISSGESAMPVSPLIAYIVTQFYFDIKAKNKYTE